MAEIEYEGEELYSKEKEELFQMDRFDPEDEVGQDAAAKETLLDDINKKLKKKRKVDDTKENEPVEAKEQPEKKKRKRSKKKGKSGQEAEGFTVLGDPTDSQKKKVVRVLPQWLANPDILQVDLQADQVPVSSLGSLLPSLLTSRLAKEGVTHLFPVQRQVIPRLLSLASLTPRLPPPDICVSAPTGSGKTLAFVLPILASLQGRLVPRVRALAVLPTQDLALQVYKVFSTYCEGSVLRVKLLTGGESVVGEEGLVRRGVGGVHQLWDILVVTPGRLTHTLREVPALDLSHLRYLVIDEADRMMATISQDWLTALETAVYTRGRPRPSPFLTVATSLRAAPRLPLQKLLFSATLSQDPEQLEQLNLFEPKLFRCVVPPKEIVGGGQEPGEFTLPAELTQEYLSCESSARPLLVSLLVRARKLQRALVFTHSNESVHRLALLLTNMGHRVGELHSQVKHRRKLLNQLESGALELLVCSDALARGIDVNCLDGVISYDTPSFLKTYIHRVGRTARAGKAGVAITLCENKQVKPFLKMLRDGNIVGVEKVEVGEVEVEEGKLLFKQSMEKTKTDLEEEKQKKHTKRQEKKKSKQFIHKNQKWKPKGQ